MTAASLLALFVVLVTAATANAQPFAAAGTACAIGRTDERGLHRVYWELLDLSEICLDIPVTPASVKLSFMLVYNGKSVSADPVSILVRVQAHAWVGPELPAFTLDLDGHRMDLISPKRRYELAYPCPPAESCAFNGVVVALTAEELRLIAASRSAAGQVFGANFTIPIEGLRAVEHLVALLGGGHRHQDFSHLRWLGPDLVAGCRSGRSGDRLLPGRRG